MGARLRLELTAAQRAELEHLRDHHRRPYLRERAAALLKIADGRSGTDVAAHGLLRYRKQETLYAWVHRYQADGVAGLTIRAGRGRKPAFSPCLPDCRTGTDTPVAGHPA